MGLLKFDDILGDLSSLIGYLSLQNGAAILTDSGDLTITGTLIAKEVKTEKVKVLGTDSGVATSSASIGRAVLPTGTQQLTIQTDAVSTGSAIFVTPDFPVALAATATDSGRFIISMDKVARQDININWWVIN